MGDAIHPLDIIANSLVPQFQTAIDEIWDSIYARLDINLMSYTAVGGVVYIKFCITDGHPKCKNQQVGSVVVLPNKLHFAAVGRVECDFSYSDPDVFQQLINYTKAWITTSDSLRFMAHNIHKMRYT